MTCVFVCACACARATTQSARPRHYCGGGGDDVVGSLTPGSLGHQTQTRWWVLQAACSPDAASARGSATTAIDRPISSFLKKKTTKRRERGEKGGDENETSRPGAGRGEVTTAAHRAGPRGRGRCTTMARGARGRLPAGAALTRACKRREGRRCLRGGGNDCVKNRKRRRGRDGHAINNSNPNHAHHRKDGDRRE